MLRNQQTPKRDHTTPDETCCSFFNIYCCFNLYIDTAFSVTTKSKRTAGRVKRAKEYYTSTKGRQIKAT